MSCDGEESATDDDMTCPLFQAPPLTVLSYIQYFAVGACGENLEFLVVQSSLEFLGEG